MDPARVAGFSRVFGMGNAYDADHVAKLLLQTAFRHLDAYQKVVQQVAWRRWQRTVSSNSFIWTLHFSPCRANCPPVQVRLGRNFSAKVGAVE